MKTQLPIQSEPDQPFITIEAARTTIKRSINTSSLALLSLLTVLVVCMASQIGYAQTIISGTVQVGQTLAALGGSGSYQWYHEGSAISGATASTYVIPSSDIGNLIQVSRGGVLSALAGPVIGTTVRYVSSSAGNDTWDGTEPAFVSGTTGPWKTIAKVNAQTFAPGTSVLFKRGDTWREQLSPTSSGTSGNPIVFDAYGTGDAPLILGSVSAANTSDWTLISGNIWKSTMAFPPVSQKTVTFSGSPGNVVVTWSGPNRPSSPVDGRGVVFYTTGTLPAGLVLGQGYFIRNASGATSNLSATPTGALVTISSAGSGTHTAGVNGFPGNKANDIGNLIFTSGGVTQTGKTTYAIWTGQNDSNLTSQGQWYFGISDWKVHVYSTSNPATAMPELELGIDRIAIYPVNKSFNIYQNLAVKYAAGSGIMIFQSTNVTVRDNYVAWIGGGNLNGDNIRYGDGIDVILSGSNHLIERNLIEQCFDAGPTLQPLNSSAPQSNIVFRNNIIKNGTQGSIGLLSFGAQLDNVSIYNNTVYNSFGWSEGQRWGPGGTSQNNQRFGLYHSVTGTPSPTNYNNKNNAYAGLGTSCSLVHPSSPANAWGGAGNMMLDYNLWSRENGSAPTTCLGGSQPTLASWAAGYSPPQEPNGLIGVDPALTNAGAGDFTPLAGSPLLNAGTNLYAQGVVWDFNKNPRPASGAFDIGAYQHLSASPLPTPDTTPPSTPTALAGTAISSSQINLTWIASTDNVGVTGYKVFRNAVQVGTSATASYSDIGLVASIVYTYTVSAYDAAGNTSAQSTSVNAITLGSTAPTIAISSRVLTTANLNVRESASMSATKLGTESVGSLGTVVGGPTTANSHTWWQINYDDGISGWSISRYLAPAAASSAPTFGVSGFSPLASANTSLINKLMQQVIALTLQIQALAAQTAAAAAALGR